MKIPRPKLFKKKENHFNIIDLGTTNVKVAVVREADGVHEREVRGESVRLQPLGNMYGGQIINLDGVIDIVGQALDDAVLKASVSPHRTVLGLSGGIMVPKSFKVRVKRQSPDEPLDEKEFDVLAKQIEDKTMDKAISELDSLGNGKYVRVETIFTDYFVDGARVNSPLGLPGSSLEITLLHYFMEETKLRGFNNLVDQLDLEVVSMVDTAVNAAINWMSKYGDFSLIDIGGDATQIVVVSNGKVAMSECLFIGGIDVTQAIAERVKVSYEEAESLKLKYAQAQVPHEKLQDVRSAISDVVDIIVDGVVESFRNSGIDEMPNTILIDGESRHLHEFKTALSSFPWTKESNFSVFPKIELAPGKDPNFEGLLKIEL